MKRIPLLLVLSALSAGCAEKLSENLKNAADWAQAQDPCRSVIPGEWAHSFPVPSDDPGGRRFKIFFYAAEGAPPRPPVLYEPHGEALIDADSHAPLKCEMWPVRANPIEGRLWPLAMKGLSVQEFEKRSDRLLDSTEKVAKVYATRRAQPTAADVSVAKEFFKLFDAQAEPLYRATYYKMNPAFWEWLRGVAGESIPKA